MVGWRGTTGTKSTLGLYQWDQSSYTVLQQAQTAPLPANKWFRMQVRVVGNTVTVFTNKDPLGLPSSTCSQVRGSDVDPVNCNGDQEALSFTFPLPFVERGGVGLYFAGASGFSDDLTVRLLPVGGFCGDGTCQEDKNEDCINCPSDCAAPCGCGDGVCAGDDEALGCPDDCFDGVPRYYNPTRVPAERWRTRVDRVAAYWSFDDPDNIGRDDSGNRLTLIVSDASSRTDVCASTRFETFGGQSENGCVETKGGFSFLFLKSASSAFAKLPVSSAAFTVAAFAKLTDVTQADRASNLIRWGSTRPDRFGLATQIRLEFGSDGSNGVIVWSHGLHEHRVTNVNWNKAGLRHLVFVYDA